jgi:hypothetical protein
LDAIKGAAELDMGGQSCTTIPNNVSGFSKNEPRESVVDRGLRARKAKVMSSILMGGSV